MQERQIGCQGHRLEVMVSRRRGVAGLVGAPPQEEGRPGVQRQRQVGGLEAFGGEVQNAAGIQTEAQVEEGPPVFGRGDLAR